MCVCVRVCVCVCVSVCVCVRVDVDVRMSNERKDIFDSASDSTMFKRYFFPCHRELKRKRKEDKDREA